jgi:hypothetical protein
LLFNLSSDPDETTNLIAQFPDQAKELMSLFEKEKTRGAQRLSEDSD